MERVLDFVHLYLEEEYRAVVAQYTQRDPAQYDRQMAKLSAFSAPDVDIVTLHRPFQPDDKFFAIGEEKLAKGELGKRVLFQVKLYKHSQIGLIYRVYLGPDEVFSQPPTYASNIFVTEIDGNLKIVSIYQFNRWFPQRKGPSYIYDNELGWNYASGQKIKSLGTLLEVRKFQAPRDVSGTLAEYNAE